ncbi:uncharacterized protein [Typha angustifolia]|uniref:uncharacterized protein n=1 Tax=Typha angustifolia TaxID=59011 RepID=UPI003C2FDEEF
MASFANAHKGGTEGKTINPTDPKAFSKDIPSAHAPDPEAPKIKNVTSGETDVMAQNPPTDSSDHGRGDRRNSGDPPRRAGKVSGGSDHSVEQSPLHPHHQVRAARKSGASSPFREGKGSTDHRHGVGSKAAGRSRIKTGGKGDESPDTGSAVPKFGEWDEKDPSAADNYTGIFNKVRDEKRAGTTKSPMITDDNKYLYGSKQQGNRDSSRCSCLGWWKK